MSLDNTITKLKELFQEDFHKKKKIDAFQHALRKLQSKEEQLKSQIQTEENPKICRELARYLLVTQAQQKKGKRLIAELLKPADLGTYRPNLNPQKYNKVPVIDTYKEDELISNQQKIALQVSYDF